MHWSCVHQLVVRVVAVIINVVINIFVVTVHSMDVADVNSAPILANGLELLFLPILFDPIPKQLSLLDQLP
ncbi:MAG: hypothetical protein EZS28_054509 [Streblomastix strix]|uniref:Uncharacterized protein n=1 Tax=Streblomastix strix TaxID=222440 RepID=A0A5J4QLJ9_9EUKA|nr:MAG: hypothetical protein EZS28_054509 [Streblomastix strix]